MVLGLLTAVVKGERVPSLGETGGEAQLIAFRSGLRMNSLQMAGVAAKLNDREIKALADYMAGLR